MSTIVCWLRWLLDGEARDEVERLRVLVYREARRHEEAGNGHECWRLLDQVFLKRRTPPATEEERRSLAALAGCYTDPLPGPPLR